MKSNLKYMLIATFVACIFGVFAACSDDNNPETSVIINPQNVFTGGVPKSFAGALISVNADGQVSAIKTEDGTDITFQYVNQTRATSAYDVIMTIDNGGSEVMICNLKLGSNGFVSHCDETTRFKGEIEKDTWDFAYNNSGQLTQMIRSEGGKEKTTIKYESGNIVEVNTISEEEPDETSTYKIYYTSDRVNTPIDNKGCIMLFDNTLGIDMDEMRYAYFAGLLGKATRHLPLRCTDMKENFTDDFIWTLNSAGYPIMLSIEDGKDKTTMSFAW